MAACTTERIITSRSRSARTALATTGNSLMVDMRSARERNMISTYLSSRDATEKEKEGTTDELGARQEWAADCLDHKRATASQRGDAGT